MPKDPKSKFYAVKIGKKPGIYTTWEECLLQIKGYPRSTFKKFYTLKAAQDFIKETEKKQGIIDIKNNKLEIINDSIIVYVDGSCEDNGTSLANAGIGVYWPKKEYNNLSEKLPGDLHTNNRAELYAVIRALEICEDKEKLLEIRTDSKYVINAYESWIPKWIENNWMRKNTLVKNRDLFEKLLELASLRKKKIIFTFIKGHSGEEGNEKADKLAKRSIL
jgi:ribonuclease HI